MKKGQVTIFIILAVLLVSAVAMFFVLKDRIQIQSIPSSLEPMYDSFLDCLEDDVSVGVDLLGVQGGRIYLTEFEEGSSYRPFSSYFNFLGNSIPYWYYVSGNGIEKEAVPSVTDMENDLETFLEKRIVECSLESFHEEGYVSYFGGEVEADVIIKDGEVEAKLEMDLNLEFFNDTATIKSHRVTIKSKLGSLYNSAFEIYQEEQENFFLERYGIDVLRLYAPVDGVELSCSPKIWIGEDILSDVLEATEANTLAIKTKNGDYELSEEDNKYFVTDIEVSHDVRFLASKNWPYFFEVAPTEDNILIAKPVGNQQGLGALGFCYVPYHFVYDYGYPVLVQVMSGEELFQFPTTVIIRGTKPRKPLEGAEAIGADYPLVCEHANTQLDINVYDYQSNRLDTKIYFECVGVSCSLGEVSSTSGTLFVPQCVNGFVVAKVEGYEDGREMVSTVQESFVNLYLKKLYEKEINLELDGKLYSGDAMITFVGEEKSKTIIYPQQKTVELSEGSYEIQVRIYSDSNIKIGATSTEKCMEVPKEGVSGFFGFKEEKCFTIEMPEQLISNSISGGGNQNYYILEQELVDSNFLNLNAQSLPVPKSLEKIQENLILVEEKSLEVIFE